MTAREEIAGAASTVDGIEVTPRYTGATKDGSGWVELARDEWPNQLGAETYWRVQILCPDDTAAAQAFYEDKRLLVAKALRDSRVLIVTGTEPAFISQTDGPIRKAFIVEGHREAEE